MIITETVKNDLDEAIWGARLEKIIFPPDHTFVKMGYGHDAYVVKEAVGG